MSARGFLVVLVLSVAACATEPVDPPEPTYSGRFSASELADARKAFGVFARVCQPLMGQYGADIVEIRISKHGVRVMEHKFDPDYFAPYGCLDYRCERFGWDKSVHVEVALADDLSVIPGSYRARGHRLHFYLGGPSNPGVTTTKYPELCGFSRIKGTLGLQYREDLGESVLVPYRSLLEPGGHAPEGGSDSYAPVPELGFIGAQ